MEAIKQLVAASLAYHDARTATEEAAIRKLESEGYRIVGGGQIDGDTWHITDWRTGEDIARGDDGYEEYCEASHKINGGKLYHIDAVMDDLDTPEELYAEMPGIPDTLNWEIAETVLQWVQENMEVARKVSQEAKNN